MKILHVYKTFINDTMGGTEQVIAQLSATPKPLQFDHSVLSLTHQKPGLLRGFRGIKNIRYKEQLMLASNGMSWPMLRDFPKIIKKHDLVHYHFPWPFADLMHCIWKINKPSILTYHSDVIRQKILLRAYQPLMHRFLHSMTAIVATSPQYLASSPVLQQYQEKTSVIPLGIDRDSFPALSIERVAHWKQRFGQRFFLFVGMMRYYKGLPILLEAIKLTGYPLVLVGTGPCEADLKRQAQRMNIPCVHFLGSVTEEDKMALLHLCLAFVFPSILRSEAFGVSLLEAAMLGKPMISTELSTGTSFVNVHEQTGLVVPPANVLALRDALKALWEHPEAAERMGKAAALRHHALFTGQDMIQAYEKLYSRVL